MRNFDFDRVTRRAYMALLLILAVVALVGALNGHSWQWITFGACCLVLLGYAAEEADEAEKRKNNTQEGYSKTDDHNPYPMETRGGRK
ncbi:MAG: hypothetical protein IKN32_00940 [Bacteroidales bacterium]|nr:hypothetical protein [Bacteroidales bacterium]